MRRVRRGEVVNAHIPQHEGRGKELAVGTGDEGDGGKLKSMDRHAGDYSYDQSHIFELAITLLILYQNLFFGSH